MALKLCFRVFKAYVCEPFVLHHAVISVFWHPNIRCVKIQISYSMQLRFYMIVLKMDGHLTPNYINSMNLCWNKLCQ